MWQDDKQWALQESTIHAISQSVELWQRFVHSVDQYVWQEAAKIWQTFCGELKTMCNDGTIEDKEQTLWMYVMAYETLTCEQWSWS